MSGAGGTAFLPGGMQTGPEQQRPPGSVHTGPNLPLQGGAVTPPNQFVQTPPRGISQPGIMTPGHAQAHPQAPPGFNSTNNSGWQQGPVPGLPKS